MMTNREFYLLRYGDILIGPSRQVARFEKHTQFVRGRPKAADLQLLPTYAKESWHVSHLLTPEWSVATEAEIETVNLLFNPVDDDF